MPGKASMDSWLPIIGLEVHIELKTKSKMFCSCSADYFGHEPNTHVCPVCFGLPGALPVINKQAVEWTVKAGLALGCQAPLFSKFDRKNYFYPDLPKGYQISQYDLPLTQKGKVILEGKRKIGIRRVHLEEDTAKMVHFKKTTLLDFNRSGVPLMEIVTEPDIHSPQEAKSFLKKLQQIIRYLDISDCDMEKGSMRCEANISITKTKQLPEYKIEIKNLNSFRFTEKALAYEIERQKKLLKAGKKPPQETRGWDEVRQVTLPQRVKEGAADYRYFPEPDLPPIRWAKTEIQELREQLPELPDGKEVRFQKKYGLTPYQARILISNQEKADYFEEAVKVGKKHQLTAIKLANVIINKRVNIKQLLPAELVGILVKRKATPKLTGKELEKIVSQILKKNPRAVTDFQQGKAIAVEFLVGQVMRESKGRANPNQAREIIQKLLASYG